LGRVDEGQTSLGGDLICIKGDGLFLRHETARLVLSPRGSP
jgi:hypothetical protein